MSQHDHTSAAFTDFRDYFEKVIDRAWEAGPKPDVGDPRALLADMWTMMRACLMGPAGLPLMFTARNRDMLRRFLYVVGVIQDPEDRSQEIKQITKEILLAWLELADEARRHRDELWRINGRLLQKFGEAVDEVTAEYIGRTPPGGPSAL